MEVQLHAFLTLTLGVVGFMPLPLYPGERTPNTHWIGGWVASGAGLDVVVRKNSSPSSEFLVGQPVA